MVSTRSTDRTAPLRSRLGTARSVLLLSQRAGADDPDACAALLAPPQARDTTAVVLSFGGTPAAWLDRLSRRTDGNAPTTVRIIDVGGLGHDSHSDADRPAPAGTSVTVDPVAEPSDLTSVGVALSSQLEAAGGEATHVVGCVDSLTTLLHCVDLQRAFRFLHAMTGRFERADATVHCHLDPAAHDDRTVNTLKQLFDAIVEIEENGPPTVTTRRP